MARKKTKKGTKKTVKAVQEKKPIAHELAKKQREISVAEFFEKNRHLLGFDNKRKALLTTIKEAVEARKEDAEGKVCVDYSLHGGITDWNENTRKELNYYVSNGIPSFKMFMIYRKQEGFLRSALARRKRAT